MRSMMSFVHDEDGAALAEYALLVGFIALVCVAAAMAVGEAVSGRLDAFAKEIPKS